MTNPSDKACDLAMITLICEKLKITYTEINDKAKEIEEYAKKHEQENTVSLFDIFKK